MALPSARRPPELEEELLKKDEAVPTGSEQKRVLIKFNRVELFMKCMTDWYEGLSQREKSKLTKKRVIRRGLYYATIVKYPYEKLPQNWLKVLHDEHHVRFKFHSLRKRKHTFDVPETTTADSPSKKSKNPKLNGKFVDLTNVPPPKFWLDRYLKDSTILPRQLKVHKTTEQTIVYYDYGDNPEQEKDREYYTLRHDRDGVFGSFLDDIAS